MLYLFKTKLFYFLLVLILLPIQITLGIYLYFAPEIPSSSEVESVELQVPLKIFTKDGKLIGEFGEIHRTKLRFDEIPDTFVKAFLAAEDSDYFNHTGVDILSLIRAAYQFLREGEIVSGGGTITMQVARNYVLTKERTFERKLKEIFTALKIDFSFTKEEIFELYVNQIFLGNRAYGIKAAAEIYYGKSLEDLNLAQYAMIAALPKAPSRINPLINPRRAINRRNYVLRRMLALEFIDQTQFDVASSAPVTASFSGISPEVEADYLAEEIRKYIIQNYGLSAYKEGYQVFSTIDSRYQTAARDAVEEGIENYEERHGFEKPENHEYLLPESFKNRSEFFYAFAYDPFSYLDKFGIELEAKNPFYKAMEFLGGQAEFKNFKPAILISVEDKRLLTLTKEGKIENILLAFNDFRHSIKASLEDFYLLSTPPRIEALHVMRSYDLIGYLPGAVLSKVDRASMNVALESRTPFLSPEILSLTEKLPSAYCIAKNGQKAVLRYILSTLLTKSEQSLILNRPKQGFGVGSELFSKGSEEISVEATASMNKLLDMGLFSRNSDSLSWLKRGLNTPNSIWAMIVLGQWLGSLSSDDKVSISPICN